MRAGQSNGRRRGAAPTAAELRDAFAARAAELREELAVKSAELALTEVTLDRLDGKPLSGDDVRARYAAARVLAERLTGAGR